MPDERFSHRRVGWSLRRLLLRRLLALMVAGWLVGTVAAAFGLWHEIDEVLDSSLSHTALRLMLLPDAAYGEDGADERSASGGDEGDFVNYQVFDREGRLRLRSYAAPREPLDPGAPDGIRETAGWHVLTLTRDDGERRAHVAESVSHRRSVIWHSLGWLLVSLLAVLPLAAWGLRAVIGSAFATLEPARNELAGLDAQALQTLPADGLPAHGLPDELAPWLASTNALIARVQALVDSERAFAAHMAHELRTPLAAARAQAQRLARVSRDPAVCQHAEALVRQLDRLARLATRLLQLARIESGVALRHEPVDLCVLVSLVADEFGEPQRQGRLQLELAPAPVIVQGDLDALGIAFRNLIDNALKHGGDAARVVISVGHDALAGVSTVSVCDDGPGVAPELLPSLVRRFERGPAGAAEGSGLGLAMVDTIAQQSAGRLQLQSRVLDGRGFCATLYFPRAAAL